MIRLLLMLLFAFLCLDAMHVRTIVKSWFVIFAPGSASLANCLVWAIKSQTISFCSYLKSIARNNLIYTFSKTAKIHPTGSFSRPEVLFRFTHVSHRRVVNLSYPEYLCYTTVYCHMRKTWYLFETQQQNIKLMHSESIWIYISVFLNYDKIHPKP